MIELNSKINTKVEVELGVKGNTKTPKLRMLFHTPSFFIGFDGDHRTIDIPPLNNISFPETVHAILEVLLDEYNVVIWESDIKIVDKEIPKEVLVTETFNKIKVKVDFVEPEDEKKPVVEVNPKF